MKLDELMEKVRKLDRAVHHFTDERWRKVSEPVLFELARRLKLAVDALEQARKTLRRGNSRMRWYILERIVNEALDEIEGSPEQ